MTSQPPQPNPNSNSAPTQGLGTLLIYSDQLVSYSNEHQSQRELIRRSEDPLEVIKLTMAFQAGSSGANSVQATVEIKSEPQKTSFIHHIGGLELKRGAPQAQYSLEFFLNGQLRATSVLKQIDNLVEIAPVKADRIVIKGDRSGDAKIMLYQPLPSQLNQSSCMIM